MIGRRLGEYEVVARLGSGAMGTVYLGRNDDGARVAIKVLHSHLAERAGFFRRFEQEAALGISVSHENVVRVLDYELFLVDEELACALVMEYVEGRTLRRLLSDLGSLPEALLREIAPQIAAGLSAIHEKGAVHRDLKPDNVLVTDDHRVRVMDFGVAKILDASMDLTREGAFAGTIGYAAPEQLEGGEVTPATDLYALGVTLYELASGENPFRRDDASESISAHMRTVPAKLENVSPFFSEVVATLVEKRPQNRFGSAEELLGVLGAGEASEWWRARAGAATARTRSTARVPVRRETEIEGRQSEIASLRQALEAAKGGEGRAVLVQGEAGIGKSRLVDELVRSAATEGVRILYGSYSPSDGETALSAAILAAFGREGLGDSIGRHLPGSRGLASSFAAFLLQESPPETVRDVSPEALHTVLCRLAEGLAKERPLLWIVEDLHFASEDERNLFLSLARAANGVPMLLIGTARPGIPKRFFETVTRLDHSLPMTLSRLSSQEVAGMLRSFLPSGRPAEELAERVARESDGIPFFALEIVRDLVERRRIHELPDGTWAETRTEGRVPIPRKLEDLLALRLEGLAREDRVLLSVAAADGYEFDPDLVARALREARVRVLERLAAIARRSGLVRAESMAFRFDHHLVHETLYAEMSPAIRRRHHAALASAMEKRAVASNVVEGESALKLCRHLLEAGCGDRCLPYVQGALDHIERRYLHERGVRLADQVLAGVGDLEPKRRIHLLLWKAKRLDLMGDRNAEREALEEALSIAEDSGDAASLVRAQIAMGWNLLQISQPSEAERRVGAALERARAIGDHESEGRATMMLASVQWSLARFPQARELYETCLGICRRSGDRDTEMRATGNLGNLLFRLGRYEEAKEHLERCIDVAGEIGDRNAEGRTIGSLGFVLLALGQHEEARNLLEQGLASARNTGDRRAEANAVGNLGALLDTLGRYTESLQCHLRHLHLAQSIGDQQEEGVALMSLGSAYFALGRYALALQRYEAAIAVAGESGDRRTRAIALVNLGPLRALLGEFPEARRDLDEALSLCRSLGIPRPEAYALNGLADLAAKRGRTEDAEPGFGEALELRRRIGHRGGEAETLAERGVLRTELGRADAARSDLQAALQMGRELSMPNVEVVAAACLARHSAGDVEAAVSTFVLHESGVAAAVAMEARLHLWLATGDRAHLAEAKRRLDALVEGAPPECRTSMLWNVPLHRRIEEAWRKSDV